MREQIEAVVRHLTLLEVRGQGAVGGDSSTLSQSPSLRKLEDSGEAFDGFQ